MWTLILGFILFGGGLPLIAWMLLGFMAGIPARWIYNRFIREHVPSSGVAFARGRRSAGVASARGRRSAEEPTPSAWQDWGVYALILLLPMPFILLWHFWDDLLPWVGGIWFFIWPASWSWRMKNALEREEKTKGPKPTA